MILWGGDASYLYIYYRMVENARDGEGSHPLDSWGFPSVPLALRKFLRVIWTHRKLFLITWNPQSRSTFHSPTYPYRSPSFPIGLLGVWPYSDRNGWTCFTKTSDSLGARYMDLVHVPDLWRCSVAQTPQNGRGSTKTRSSQLPSTRVVVAILSLVCSTV